MKNTISFFVECSRQGCTCGYKICGTPSHIRRDMYPSMITMKLQRQVAYEYKGKTRYKYVIVIPKETIDELRWKAGEELQNSVNGRNLTIKPKKGEN